MQKLLVNRLLVVELLEYIVDALEEIADGYAREQSETESDEIS